MTQQKDQTATFGLNSTVFERYFPGIIASITIAMAATFLSEHYGGPLMLFTLLLGMAFNFSTEKGGRCIDGIEFCSKRILRFGVALLGMRISFTELNELGLRPILLVVTTVVITILVGWALARVLGLRKNFGILTGSAVAICGASAALAVSTALSKDSDSERDTLFTVVGVTALSTLAMIIYPVVVAVSGLDNFLAGVFLGATIHDVAQVVGAGYMISEQTGDVATLVKLMRVAMLVPVVFVVAVLMRTADSKSVGKASVPLFLIGFIVIMVCNNLLPIPQVIRDSVVDLSSWCLVTAIAALGMKTSFKRLSTVGGKAVSLILLETLFLAIVVMVVLHFW